MVRLVTDTTASLPPGFAAAHGVAVVPQVVRFGADSYLEEVELSSAEFIRRLKTSARLPGTAAPPPGEFIRAYARQLEGGEAVVSIHPSGEFSGTVRSAEAARAEAFPQAAIHILDTRTVAGNLSTLVQVAVTLAERCCSAAEIVAALQAMIPRSRTYFLVPTLDYLQRGGRIGGATALVGSLLQIKPLLEIRGGRVEVAEKIRAYARAYERLHAIVAERCPRTPEAYLCVMHADAAAAAERLAGELAVALGLGAVPIYSAGASITTHAGPGTLGVGYFDRG